MRIQFATAIVFSLNLFNIIWDRPYRFNWYWDLIAGFCGLVYLGYLIVHHRAMKTDA